MDDRESRLNALGTYMAESEPNSPDPTAKDLINGIVGELSSQLQEESTPQQQQPQHEIQQRRHDVFFE